MTTTTKSLVDGAIAWIQEYQKETGMKGVVIGISGGKDSSVVAALICKAIGVENVFGVLIPNGTQKDLEDSIELCNFLGIKFSTINIGETYGKLLSTCFKSLQFGVSTPAIINIAPRLRMTTLYLIAQTLGYRVAGTSNASEAYIGWCTKWGDMACDFNAIANISCTDVMLMGEELGLPKFLWDKTPADGLTNQSDEKNFGFTYNELERYMNGDNSIGKEKCVKISNMHKSSRHKFEKIKTYEPSKF